METEKATHGYTDSDVYKLMEHLSSILNISKKVTPHETSHEPGKLTHFELFQKIKTESEEALRILQLNCIDLDCEVD